MRGDVVEIHCGVDVLLLARFGALSRLPHAERGSQPAIGLMRRFAYDREAMGQLRCAWSRWISDAMSSRVSDEQLLLAVTQQLRTGALHGVALPRARLSQSHGRKPKTARRPVAVAQAQPPAPIFAPRPPVTTAADAAARTAALPKPVGQWPLEERISAVMKKTIPKVPGQFGDALLEMISPENIAIMALCIGISVAANLTPAGWIADAVLAGVAFYFGGMMAIQAIGDLIDVMRLTYSAQSDADLNAAAEKLAKVIALIGVIGLQALLYKIAAKKRVAGAETKARGGKSGAGNSGARKASSETPGNTSSPNMSVTPPGKAVEPTVQFAESAAAKVFQKPDGTLAQANKANIDPRKLTEYALNPNHPVGGHKAKVFEAALGFTIANADNLLEQLRKGVMTTPSTPGKVDARGTRFTVDIPVTGPNGSGFVRTGWIYDLGSEVPRLLTLYVK